MQTFTLADIAAMQAAGKSEEATHLYDLCLQKGVDDWAVLYHLGCLFMQTNKPAIAALMFERAIVIEPAKYELHSNLGVLLRTMEKYTEAGVAFRKAAELAQNVDADVYVNLGSLYVNEGKPERGEEILLKGYAIDPNNALVNWNLSLCFLEQGKWKEGWKCYKHGKFKHKEQDIPERPYRWQSFPQWEGENSRVITYGEQGLGDEIMFASLIPDLQEDTKSIVYECHPRLENIINRSFPEVEVWPTRKQAVINLEKEQEPPAFDHVVAMGDLGGFYRNKLEDFPGTPYLIPDPELVAKYRAMLEEAGEGPYYGIGWRGGYVKTRKGLRSIDLDTLKPILREKGTFVSMQYDEKADSEVEEFCDRTGIKIFHWPEVVREFDYDHTAAMAVALDHVICINTTLVHLCGALGIGCWSLTPSRPAWRYQMEGPIPWYNSVNLIRQTDKYSWSEPVERIINLMRET